MTAPSPKEWLELRGIILEVLDEKVGPAFDFSNENIAETIADRISTEFLQSPRR